MAFLAFLPPADFSEPKKQIGKHVQGREQKGQDTWHLQKDLTSNDGLLDERQGPLPPQPSEGLRSYNHTLNRQAQ